MDQFFARNMNVTENLNICVCVLEKVVQLKLIQWDKVSKIPALYMKSPCNLQIPKQDRSLSI